MHLGGGGDSRSWVALAEVRPGSTSDSAVADVSRMLCRRLNLEPTLSLLSAKRDLGAAVCNSMHVTIEIESGVVADRRGLRQSFGMRSCRSKVPMRDSFATVSSGAYRLSHDSLLFTFSALVVAVDSSMLHTSPLYSESSLIDASFSYSSFGGTNLQSLREGSDS